MRLLVTGGAGFIGSNFIIRHCACYPEDQIVCLDSLTYAGNLKNLDQVSHNTNFTFAHGDIADSNQVDKVFADYAPNIVINFAAETHVDRSINDSHVFIKTNIMGTQALLEACRRYKTDRFHQVSTDEVYGDLPLDRPDLLFHEDTPANPSSPYSASKASADFLVMAYYRTYGLPVTISRCSNNYGPFQFPEKLIPLMIINAVTQKSLPLYGDGKNIRDWIHVFDHCDAIEQIIMNGISGDVYNVGGNAEKTNLEVVNAIISQLKCGEIVFVKDRAGHDLRYAISSEKIRRCLGWKPKISFNEGLRQTVEWYLDNQKWWGNITGGEH